MDNIKNDDYYISRIFSDLAFVIRHMEDVDSESFSGNELLQDSMMFRLIQILQIIIYRFINLISVFVDTIHQIVIFGE